MTELSVIREGLAFLFSVALLMAVWLLLWVIA